MTACMIFNKLKECQLKEKGKINKFTTKIRMPQRDNNIRATRKQMQQIYNTKNITDIYNNIKNNNS